MDKIDHPSDVEILNALMLWTGWGTSKWPLRDESSVRTQFGAEAGKLLPILKYLAEEFYSTNARDVAPDISETGDMAAAEFRSKHPELPGQVAEILAWCYTFEFR